MAWDSPRRAGLNGALISARFAAGFLLSISACQRTWDCLLAYDPPASWDSLATVFARSPKLLSRAARERVRGTLVSLEAIRRETTRRTQAGEWEGAIAPWVETGRLLAAWPDDPRREETEFRRRQVLGRWLESGRLGLDEAFEGTCRLLDHLPVKERLRRAGGLRPDQWLAANSSSITNDQ